MKFCIVILITTIISSLAFADQFEDFTVQPDAVIANHSISEYTNLWWQWALSVPNQLNPVRDLVGTNCHQGQSGDVWFLAGGFGTSKIKRTCEIPSDKYIFFPVINMVYYRPQNGKLTCDEAKKLAALNNDELLSIEVEIDSNKSYNPAHSRFSSIECFNALAKIPKEYSYDAYPSASDGFWIMLKPLVKGTHHLKFNAQYNRDKGAYSKMAQDIEYTLIVK